ncbi:MAG: hypothetical protein NVSMB9_20940 [Isosphaeraceae bacterium]
MEHPELQPPLSEWMGKNIVVDLRSPYVCLGKLVGYDRDFLEVHDADLHDFRDIPTSREVYVYDSARVGIRRNRARVLVKRDEIVAITLLSEIVTS